MGKNLNTGYRKIRIKYLILFENTLYFFRTFGGRITSLYKFFKKRKTYVAAKSYYPEEPLKDRSSIFNEQLMHILKYGEIDAFYFAMGLDRQRVKKLDEYLPVKRMDHIRDKKNSILPEYENYNFICLLTDKFVFGSFCKGLGIPTPTNFAIADGDTLHLIESREELPLENITNYTVDAYCKIVAGLQGKGTFHLLVKDGVIYKNGSPISIQELKRIFLGNKWIIQERITDQHEALAALHPDSINTLRIVTINTGNEIEVIVTALRTGKNGSKVDNWAAGGILAAIDQEQGTLNKWGFYKPGKGTKTTTHPNSNIVFEGYRIPFFEDALQQAKRLHGMMYGIHSIGWDIAITTKGPVFVEGNARWDTAIYQILIGGCKGTFDQYFLNKKTGGLKINSGKKDLGELANMPSTANA